MFHSDGNSYSKSALLELCIKLHAELYTCTKRLLQRESANREEFTSPSISCDLILLCLDELMISPLLKKDHTNPHSYENIIFKHL